VSDFSKIWGTVSEKIRYGGSCKVVAADFAPVQATESYLAWKQNLRYPVNNLFQLGTVAAAA